MQPAPENYFWEGEIQREKLSLQTSITLIIVTYNIIKVPFTEIDSRHCSSFTTGFSINNLLPNLLLLLRIKFLVHYPHLLHYLPSISSMIPFNDLLHYLPSISSIIPFNDLLHYLPSISSMIQILRLLPNTTIPSRIDVTDHDKTVNHLEKKISFS